MAFKKYGYVLTETAESDINETFEYIAYDLSNADAAEDFIDEFESRMAESGMDPKVLQYIMGYADFSITMNVYNHISGLERVRKEVERIENEALAISF